MYVFQRKINDKNALIIQNGTGNVPKAGRDAVAVYAGEDGKLTYSAGTVTSNSFIPSGSGGSGGPEVENAIETGGIGWSEPGEPKPEVAIEWDGDIEGLEPDDSLTRYYGDNQSQFYKISNNIYSPEQFINKKIFWYDTYEPYDFYTTIVTEDIASNSFFASDAEYAYVVVVEKETHLDDGEGNTFDFYPGTYFAYSSGDDYVQYTQKVVIQEEQHIQGEVHTINPKYINIDFCINYFSELDDQGAIHYYMDKTFNEIQELIDDNKVLVINTEPFFGNPGTAVMYTKPTYYDQSGKIEMKVTFVVKSSTTGQLSFLVSTCEADSMSDYPEYIPVNE